jgi:2'-5' RNA ligase
MQYFIGVVPPDDYKNKLITFQKQWSNNLLVDVVEPHITLKISGRINLRQKVDK